ncbi:polysaccharide deacetylase family protein [Pseudogulbenkiania subflava]|uniref:Deacetylase n=1 Tax=Pseudogulbenkiania subflava DSM 22618 TaxID=1123014 RepID=A0A1Y6BFX1_9NEIS|nr:deacetylase [Pseudogulbenkiania subflava]SMF02290.1 hypothetical protein SAMN02745746_00790 [Pseudogulbenkiania subflava DSM 22618]
MKRPAFIITIDTEGDNLWGSPTDITSHNARFLPRFQELCEQYDFKPTYLTNYEMAIDPDYQRFAKDVLARGTGEVGMHLHAWNSPPLVALTKDDYRYTPYLIEYPAEVIRQKIDFMTKLLEDTFATKMVSHRAGRWAFNEFYAEELRRHGYRVDCSVTPGVDWSRTMGNPQGVGGTNYRDFPRQAYFMAEDDIARPGNSTLLQVPMTIRPKYSPLVETLKNGMNKLRGKDKPRSMQWLRPRGGNAAEMIDIAEAALNQGSDYVEFMLHSSEFMPGGSPTFKDEASIDRLYQDLRKFFDHISKRCNGQTLSQYHDHFVTTLGNMAQ